MKSKIKIREERSNEVWKAAAYEAFVSMAYEREVFTTGHVRRQFQEDSKLRPRDNRAWGGVTRRAIKEKVVKRTKIWQATGSHCRPDAVWRSMIVQRKSAK